MEEEKKQEISEKRRQESEEKAQTKKKGTRDQVNDLVDALYHQKDGKVSKDEILTEILEGRKKLRAVINEKLFPIKEVGGEKAGRILKRIEKDAVGHYNQYISTHLLDDVLDVGEIVNLSIQDAIRPFAAVEHGENVKKMKRAQTRRPVNYNKEFSKMMDTISGSNRSEKSEMRYNVFSQGIEAAMMRFGAGYKAQPFSSEAERQQHAEEIETDLLAGTKLSESPEDLYIQQITENYSDIASLSQKGLDESTRLFLINSAYELSSLAKSGNPNAEKVLLNFNKVFKLGLSEKTDENGDRKVDFDEIEAIYKRFYIELGGFTPEEAEAMLDNTKQAFELTLEGLRDNGKSMNQFDTDDLVAKLLAEQAEKEQEESSTTVEENTEVESEISFETIFASGTDEYDEQAVAFIRGNISSAQDFIKTYLEEHAGSLTPEESVLVDKFVKTIKEEKEQVQEQDNSEKTPEEIFKESLAKGGEEFEEEFVGVIKENLQAAQDFIRSYLEENGANLTPEESIWVTAFGKVVKELSSPEKQKETTFGELLEQSGENFEEKLEELIKGDALGAKEFLTNYLKENGASLTQEQRDRVTTFGEILKQHKKEFLEVGEEDVSKLAEGSSMFRSSRDKEGNPAPDKQVDSKVQDDESR